MVDSNIAWVHNNCDSGTVTMSERTKVKMRKMALEKLFDAAGSAVLTAQAWALYRWKNVR